MTFLPFEKYTLITKLPATEVTRRLQQHIGPRRNWLSKLRDDSFIDYEGYLMDGTFKISRSINYNNSFLPVIKGEIANLGEYTAVRIVMRPEIFVIIFMTIWFGLTGVVCLLFLVAGLRHFQELLHAGVSPGVVIPFFMFAFGYGLVQFGFHFEKRKSKRFLKELLQAEG